MTPKELSERARKHADAARALVPGAGAWDVQAFRAHRGAAREWRQAEELWWDLALTGMPIARGEARRHVAAARGTREIEDLKGHAIEGLYRAAQLWDPSGAASWRTYAGGGCRMRIRLNLRAGSETTWVSNYVRAQAAEVRRYLEDAERQGLQITLREAAELAGMTPELLEAYMAQQRVVPIDDSPIQIRGETPDPVEGIDSRRVVERVQAALAQLPERQASVLRARMDDRTCADIGRELNLSRERVRQIEIRALEALTALLHGRPMRLLLEGERAIDLVREALERRGPSTVDEIAVDLGLHRQTVWRCTRSLGVQVRRGVWALVAA